jgi:hypothetical protein
MKHLARVKPIVFFCFSAAGLGLAFKASLELSEHRWPSGLKYAGCSVYLVLMPFLNYPALVKISSKSVSLENANDPSLRLLPGKLGFVGLFGLILLISGTLVNAFG